MKRKKVLFIIPHMTCGGAERVLSTILKFLNRSRFKLVLVVYGSRFVYDIPADVRVIDLRMDGSNAGVPRRLLYFFGRTFKIRAIMEEEKPDIVFSMLTGPTPMISRMMSRHRPRIVVRETTYVSLGLHGLNGMAHKLFVRVFYPKADLIITATEDARRDLIGNFGVPPDKIRIVHNPIDLEYVRKSSREAVHDRLFASGVPVIATVGRLSYLKGYGYLLKAFSLLREDREARLVFLGEGADREDLERLSCELGVGDDVFFHGFDRNPFRYVRRAHVFVLPSLFEGFPNALIEAMACGTAVISTDCHSGPREIIDNGKNGILVPLRDEHSLCRAMKMLIDDAGLRRRLSGAGKKRATDFNVHRIMEEYGKLLEGL